MQFWRGNQVLPFVAVTFEVVLGRPMAVVVGRPVAVVLGRPLAVVVGRPVAGLWY